MVGEEPVAVMGKMMFAREARSAQDWFWAGWMMVPLLT